MAALIGRLGGSAFQRTQERLMHTQLQSAGARPTQDLQLLKERLYESLSKTEKDPMTMNWRDRLLVQHLAGHVKPRPNDWQWRRLRVSGTLNNVIHTTGIAGIVFVSCLFAAAYKRLGAEGMKAALQNAKKQEQC